MYPINLKNGVHGPFGCPAAGSVGRHGVSLMRPKELSTRLVDGARLFRSPGRVPAHRAVLGRRSMDSAASSGTGPKALSNCSAVVAAWFPELVRAGQTPPVGALIDGDIVIAQ